MRGLIKRNARWILGSKQFGESFGRYLTHGIILLVIFSLGLIDVRETGSEFPLNLLGGDGEGFLRLVRDRLWFDFDVQAFA
jgi:hypothetical protein